MQAQLSSKKTGIWDLLKCRNFSILLMASFISRFGDSVDAIAYGWMVYRLTGSKLLLGTIFAVNALPNIILGPFAGVLADRMDKRKLMIFSYGGRGVIVVFLAFLFVNNLLRPWHLFTFTIITSTLETLMSPASVSILPMIINKDMYLSANSFSSSISTFAQLLGAGAAGAIIGFWGIAGAIFIDGATFFAAAVLIVFLRLQGGDTKNSEFSVKGYIADIKEGFDFVRKTEIIAISMLLFAVVNFCVTPVNVLMPAFISDVLKSGPKVLSLLSIAFSAGTILGGILMSQFGSRYKETKLIAGGFFIFGISYAALVLPGYIIKGFLPSVLITVVIFSLIGLLIPVVASPIKTHMMRNTDPKILGRIAAFMTMISLSAIPLGSALTGFISEYVSISIIFLVMGIIVALLAVSLFFNKTFRSMGN
jgi:MFS transporter, DHA3 family, macrolide efflux protein